jgi:hypothetical protein
MGVDDLGAGLGKRRMDGEIVDGGSRLESINWRA